MPNYEFTHPTTGKTVTVSGPAPPDEATLDQIFANTATANRNTGGKSRDDIMATPAADIEDARMQFVRSSAALPTRVKEEVRHYTPSRKTIADFARPSLEGIGAAGGGITGAALAVPADVLTANPLPSVMAGVAGAGIGYTGGKKLADLIEGAPPPASLADATVKTLNDFATGSTYEMGGQLVGKGIGKVLNQAAKVRASLRRSTPAITEEGLNAKAGQIIEENTSPSPIFDQNAEEAAKLEIAGFKPSLGEARNDPGLIKLQRGIAVQPGTAGTTIMGQKAANQAALREHVADNFPSPEGVADVVDSLAADKAALQGATEQGTAVADAAKGVLNPADAQTVGRGITDTIDGSLAPLKTAEREAWSKVPNYPIPSHNFDAAADVLKKTPLEADTKAAVDKIIDYAGQLPRTTEGLQSIERTIDDKMYAPTVDPNVKRVLGSLKRAIGEDFAAMGEAADAGDIALWEGKIVHPSKMQAELATIEQRIAEEQAKAAVPDIDAMRVELMGRGVPAMKQMGESESQYAARLAKQYEVSVQQPPPTIAGESKALPDLMARRERLAAGLENLQPAQDVAAAYRAAKDVSKERFDRFDTGVISDITRDGKQASGLKLPDALIPAKVFTPDGADDFIRAMGGGEAGTKAAAVHADQYAAQQLLSKANPLTGELKPEVIAKWFKDNLTVLRKYGISEKYSTLAKAQAQVEAAKGAEAEFNRSIAAKILGADPDKAIEAAMQGNSGMHGGGLSAKNTGGIMQDLVNRVQGNPQALRGLQNAFKDFIITKATTTAKTIGGDSIISPASIQKEMAKYAPAMKVLYANEPAKLSALQRVAKAVEIQSRSDRSPVGAGSDTAEKISMAMSIITKAADIVPGAHWLTKMAKVGLSKLNEINAQELNRVIVRALYDPEFAQTLAMAARRYKPQEVAKRVNSHLMTLGIYAIDPKNNDPLGIR